MIVTVKLFGPQARLTGKEEVPLDLPPGATCAALRDALAEAEPGLVPTLPQSRFAVNHAYAPEAQPLEPGDEVALIGMVSGG